MKKISLILVIAMVIGLLAGCAGTPVVYYTDCPCPTGSHSTPATDATTPTVSAEGEIKTGVYIGVTMKNTDNSGAVVDGMVEYDVTVAAVTVDENGVILACRLDSIGTSLAFEGGALGIDPKDHPPILSKNELGDSYGMKGNSGIGAEWYQQAQALADYAVGKTVEQLRSGAVDETGHAADADLATSATIYLGGYVSAIEGAVANAKPLGAQAGDELRLAAISSFGDSTNPADGKDEWFAKIKEMCEPLGFTPNVKEYKKTPEAFKGHVGDVSTVIRVAVTGRTNTPDLHAILASLGKERVFARLDAFKATL